MKTLTLLLCLLPSIVFAQVTGQCGAGRTCAAKNFVATAGKLGGSNFCDDTTNVGWSWAASTSNYTLTSYLAGSKCGGGAVIKLNVNVNDEVVRSSTVGGFGAGTGGFTAPLAFASFPAAASSTGRLLYDSTNSVWRWSDGTNWNVLAQEYTQNAYHPALAPGAGVTLSYANTRTPAVVRAISGQTLTLGSGAGTYTVEVYDLTAAAVRCTSAALACNAANQFSTNCSGAIPAGNAYAIRINSAACATTPVLNLTALLSGG